MVTSTYRSGGAGRDVSSLWCREGRHLYRPSCKFLTCHKGKDDRCRLLWLNQRGRPVKFRLFFVRTLAFLLDAAPFRLRGAKRQALCTQPSIFRYSVFRIPLFRIPLFRYSVFRI